MGKLLGAAQHWLAGTRLMRRLREHFLHEQVRHRVAQLDALAIATCQKRILSSLIHKARATPFGRDHDFARICDAADFRRLVPLQTPQTLSRNYGPSQLPLPSAGNAVRAGDLLPVLPLSSSLIAAHHATLVSALALAAQVRPDAWQAPWLFLGSSLCYVGNPLHAPVGLDPHVPTRLGWLQGFAPFQGPFFVLREVPRPGKVSPLAAQQTPVEITCLAGNTDQLLRFLGQAKREAERIGCTAIWPALEVVLFSGDPQGNARELMRQAIGREDITLLETYIPAEGPVAVEDPRHGLLRFLPDVGSYCEFVPVHELGKPAPTRHEASAIEPGLPYALALSSPAGLWACLTGARLRFERRDPPLFRLLQEDAPREEHNGNAAPAPLSAAHPFPAQAPHWHAGVAEKKPMGQPFRESARRAGRR